MVRVGADTSGAERELKGFGSRLGSMAGTLAKTGAALTAGLTLPIVGAAKEIASLGIDFESAFTGVIKTVDASAEELDVLRQGILDMSKELPASAVEIANVAEAAGQLGISQENILGFTRTMIDLGQTTNLTANEAADNLARLANITQMPQDEFDNLGSTIVALGNAGASTEQDIVSLGMRLAAAGNQVGMSNAEILGFASALSSVGIEAEAGGTAFSRVMIDIAQEVATGGKKLKTFAKVSGKTSDQFVKAWQEDAAGAMIDFVEGLGAISDAGGNVFGVLDELDLSDIRVRDSLLRASGAGDLFRESIVLANEAWTDNIALTKEASTRYATTQSKLNIMTNRFKEFGITLFTDISPALNSVIDQVSEFALNLTPMVQGFIEANPELTNLALGFTAFLAALGPVALALSGLLAAIGFLISPLGLLSAAIVAVGVAWTTNFLGIQDALQPAITAVKDLVAGIGQIAATGAGEITLGPVEVKWTPEKKTVKLGDFFTGSLTLKDHLTSLNINDVIKGTWTPDYGQINVADLVKGTWTPTVKKVSIGDLVQGTLDLGKHMVKLKVGDFLDFSGTLGPEGQIHLTLNEKDFDIDLAPAIANMQSKIKGLATEIQNAWNAEGWTGLGDLAIEKVSGLGTDIATGLGQMVLFAQLGLILAVAQAKAELSKAFVGPEATVFDVTGFVATIRKQFDEAWDRIDKELGITPLIDTIKPQITDMIQGIKDAFVDFDAKTAGEQLTAVINAITGAITAISAIKLDVLNTATTDLTNLLTGILDFATSVVDSLDTATIAKLLGEAVTSVSDTIKTIANPDNLGKIGTEVGKLVGAIINKLGDLIAAPKFGEDVGTAIGEAVGAIAKGALTFVTSFLTELNKIPWTTVSAQTDIFVQHLVSGIAAGLAKADLTPIATAFVQALSAAIYKLSVVGVFADAMTGKGAFAPKPGAGGFGGEGGMTGGAENKGWFKRNFGDLFGDLFGKAPSVSGEPRVTGPGVITGREPQVTGPGVISGLEPQVVDVTAQITEVVPPKEPVEIEAVVPTADILRELKSQIQFGPPVPIPVEPTINLHAAVMGGGLAGLAQLFGIEMENAIGKAKAGIAGMIGPSLEGLSQKRGGGADVGPAPPPAFEWPDYPPFTWPEYLPFEWPTLPTWSWPTLPEWKWPALPTFSWPAYPTFTWPSYPTWTWPALPSWHWPPIPMPDWVNLLIHGGIGQRADTSIPTHASGTDYWRGGWTWVGERGPELVRLPRGSAIYSNEESMAMAGSTVNVYATVNSDIDVEKMAYRVAQVINRKSR